MSDLGNIRHMAAQRQALTRAHPTNGAGCRANSNTAFLRAYGIEKKVCNDDVCFDGVPCLVPHHGTLRRLCNTNA